MFFSVAVPSRRGSVTYQLKIQRNTGACSATLYCSTCDNSNCDNRRRQGKEMYMHPGQLSLFSVSEEVLHVYNVCIKTTPLSVYCTHLQAKGLGLGLKCMKYNGRGVYNVYTCVGVHDCSVMDLRPHLVCNHIYTHTDTSFPRWKKTNSHRGIYRCSLQSPL